jgi:hypothetical protein
MRALSRYVWLDAQMADAVKNSYGPGHAGWDEFRFARAAARDIQSLGDSGEGACSAVLLVRVVAELLIRATLARSGSEAEPSASGAACWSRLLEQPSAARIVTEFSQEQLELIASVLAPDGSLFLTRHPPRRLKFVLSTMADLTQMLLAPLDADANRVKRVRTRRWRRLTLLVLGAVLGLTLLWRKASEQTNLALHKHVTVDQSDAQWVKDPRGLVDGNKEELGFHTITAANQTATIDLGRPQRISRIVVYNRIDCCEERAVPLKIDISEDGKNYRTVAQRSDVFRGSWTVEFPKSLARYVRLTDLKAAAFHLNEVEVY